MSTEITYTARERFGPAHDAGGGIDWERYVAWSRLHHVEEVVSLDGMLNGLAFEPDFDSEAGWAHMMDIDGYFFGLYSSLPYVLERVAQLRGFNLLTVVPHPDGGKSDLSNEFELVGSDLLDRSGDISALVNCGGFDDTFLPEELNRWGLISEYARARKVQRDLLANNPEEYHADCVLYAVWRHGTVGR